MTLQHPIEGILDILQEALEGGAPGQGTAFLDGTAADGSGNHGLLPTLARLSAEQASQLVYGTSVAGHARHSALHLEVAVRWDRDGERGPFPWKDSFQPAQVDEAEWKALQERVRRAAAELRTFALSRRESPLDGDVTGGLTASVAHVAYHLGAIRQMLKEIGAA